jgi:hypothetical protein
MRARGGWNACLVFALLLLAGCADPPTKEISRAQGALDAARAAGAADYATEEFRAAETSLDRSLQFVDERDYRQALSFALDARERAQVAARQAADEKARVRTEADRLLRASEAGLEQARGRLATAAEARVTRAALAGPKKAVDGAASAVESARTAFDQGSYRQSIEALAPVGDSLEKATSEIDAAIEARQARRPARRRR